MTNFLALVVIAMVTTGLTLTLGLQWIAEHNAEKARLVLRQAFAEFKYTSSFDAKYNRILPAGYALSQEGNCLVLRKKGAEVERLCRQLP